MADEITPSESNETPEDENVLELQGDTPDVEAHSEGGSGSACASVLSVGN
jgi:hypothetical protein